MPDLMVPLQSAVATALEHYLTVTASTKRSTLSGGKVQTPTTYISELKCTPFIPWQAEQARTPKIEIPYEMLETYVKGSHDIQEGDLLVVGTDEYPVRVVSGWPEQSPSYHRLLLEAKT